MYAALGPAPKGDFPPGVWELDLIHSLPPNADSTLGFMPMIAGGIRDMHAAIPEGVYKVPPAEDESEASEQLRQI